MSRPVRHVSVVDLSFQLVRRGLFSLKLQHLAWCHRIWLCSLCLSHIRRLLLALKLWMVNGARSCNPNTFLCDLWSWMERWAELVKTFAHCLSTCWQWDRITFTRRCSCQKRDLFSLLLTFLRLHITVISILLHLPSLKFILICLHDLIAITIVEALWTIHTFWLTIILLLVHLSYVLLTLASWAIFKVF